MLVCGVVAEYNPFHLGHAYHLAETRRYLGESTALVCAMSGNFVQRGDFALLDKYERAAMAVEGGADLVVELPLPAALSSAEGFARGAVSALAALGCSRLSFGAECDDLDLLRRAAALRQSGELRPLLAESLRAGLSYPAAVQRAMARLDPQAAALLSSPNNTLGIAYCAALAESGIEPLVIARAGAAHDSEAPAGGFASASLLRTRIVESVQTGAAADWSAYLPAEAAARLSAALQEGRAPMLAAHCDTALLAHLRRLDADALRPFALGGDGFAARLFAAVQSGCTFAEVCGAARTRRYPLARVRRALLRAYLNLPDALSPEAGYLRVLALNARGAELLRQARLPCITKPTSERTLPADLQPALRRDALSDALYALAAPAPAGRSPQSRWRKTPFVLR